MFKLSSLYIASGNKHSRLLTLVIGVSAFLAPFSNFAGSTVNAQTGDDFYAREDGRSDGAAAATPPVFVREYLPSAQDSGSATKQDSLRQTDSFASSGDNVRGRGNGGGGGGTFPPANPQWTIAATPGVKFSVDHEGWYRVTASELQAAGFPVGSNQTYWQLFTDALEQPMKVNADGSIEFYGKEIDTAYSGMRTYYLIYGSAAGKRIALSGSKSSNSSNASNFDITVERKQRIYYVPGILNGDAENWFGNLVEPSRAATETLSVYNQDTSGTARLNVKLQGLSDGQHTVDVRFNNLSVGTASFSNFQNATFGFDVPMSAVVSGDNQVSLQSVSSSGDYNLVDSVSLTYKRRYEARDNRLHFSVPARKGLQVSDFTESAINVFELQNGQVSSEVSVRVDQTGGTYGFTLSSSNNNRELIAVTNSRKESPAKIEPNAPTIWNSASNGADFLIIAPAVFASYAQTLADMRVQQGINARVVLTDDIFDEFGNGAASAQAVKDFLKHAATNWQVKPRYVLLFGDSSYDARNYLGRTDRNLVPTKMIDTQFFETASDTWYADFNDDTVEDIAIGRLPAGNAAEAAQMIQKLARYDAQGPRQTNKGVFVADTLFAPYSVELANLLPPTAQASMINRQQMTDTQMQQAIFTEGSDNPRLVVYTGHGTTVGWTNAGLLSVGNVGNLSNSQLGFYMIVGCLNGYSQDPYGDSFAEALLKAPNGAMGVFASTGSIIVSGPTAMSPVVTDKIFNAQPGSEMRIGDILRLAKQNSLDVDSKRTYQLFGDPTVFIR